MSKKRESFYVSDYEIQSQLDKQKNKSEYICNLIKKDIEDKKKIELYDMISDVLLALKDTNTQIKTSVSELKQIPTRAIALIDGENNEDVVDDKVLIPTQTIIIPDESQKRAALLMSFGDDDF